MLNYWKLKGQIIAKHQTIDNFAKELGISRHTAYNKLKGKTAIKPNEIVKWCDILDIPKSEIADYFFCNDCQV